MDSEYKLSFFDKVKERRKKTIDDLLHALNLKKDGGEIEDSKQEKELEEEKSK